MPVKHVASLELRLPEQIYEIGMGGESAGGLPDFGSVSFTGRSSNADFDVVPFKVVLVIDQRDLALVINEIARANFYTALNVNYSVVPSPTSDDAAIGYLYGHEPIVLADLDFEGYFFREAYHHRWPEGGPREVEPGEPPDELTDHPFMPDVVRAALDGAEGMGMMGLHASFAVPQGGQAGRGSGAGGLRAMREEVLLDTMYERPSRSDVARVVIDEQVVRDRVNPTLVPISDLASADLPEERSA